MVMCQCSHVEVRGSLWESVLSVYSVAQAGPAAVSKHLSASTVIIKPSQPHPFNLHLLCLAFKSLTLVSLGVAVKVSDHPHSLCPAQGRTPNL